MSITDTVAAALPNRAVQTVEGLPFPRVASGKVREIFDLGDALLLVATDRLSAFDVILPDGIPGKGIILTQMSNWWFAQTAGIIRNHLLADQPRALGVIDGFVVLALGRLGGGGEDGLG